MTAEMIWPTRRSDARAADIAQARLFDDLLQEEIAELQELAEHAQSRELLRVNARISEVRRLLDALRDRFPGSLS